MKIAFLFDAIYPYNKGGKEKRLYDLSIGLAKRGHDVTIYSMKWWEGDKEIIENGVKLHAISPYYPLYKGRSRSMKQSVFFGLHSFKMLFMDFDVLDADQVVFFQHFPAKLACVVKRKKFFITWNEVWSKEYWIKYSGKTGYIGYWLQNTTAKLADKINSISEFTKNNLIKVMEIPADRIYDLEPCINFSDIEKLTPAAEQSDLIYAGRLISHKNVDLLLKSVSILKKTFPEIKCTIVGDGPDMQLLQDLSRKLDIAGNVNFKGFIESHDDMLALVKSSKVFVFPSTREGLGIVLVEANACGKPVVTIDHEDNASKTLIIEGKNGYLSTFDAIDLSDKIKLALENASNMRETCIAASKRHDWDALLPEFEKNYSAAT